jgi:hypothetical protein
VLRVTDKPDKDGFLENLQAALVKAMEIHDVKEYMEDVEKFSSDLIYEASKIYTGNSMPMDGYPGFETWFFNDSTGIYHLDNKVNHLVSTLEGKTSVTEGQDLLTFSCTASTVFATGWKVWMQYNAYKLQAQHARGDDSGFASGSAKWQEAFGNIGWYLFGISNPYYAPTTTISKKGYGNRIDTWIQTTRKARIDQIKPPERVKKTVASYTMKPGPGYKSAVTYKEIPGWRFVDEADNDVWKHFRKDTEEKVDTCHTKTVEHADEVRTEYNNWVAEVTKQLDAVSAKVTQTITALKASIDEMSSQMPPLPPTTLPIVTLHTTGTATPKGLWTNGATVSYQIAFANDHVNGNDHQYGNFGPATTPLTIGDFAGAKLTNLPQHSNKNFYIYILRTINTPGSKPVVRMLVPVKMGTLEFDDVA